MYVKAYHDLSSSSPQASGNMPLLWFVSPIVFLIRAAADQLLKLDD